MPNDIPLPKGVLDSPLSMLCFYDEDIQMGIETNGVEGVLLDTWQQDILSYFGRPHKYGDPELRAMLLAANGSGKSQYILTPLAIWMIMRWQESLTVITSSSGAQLDGQDLRYCTRLANKINAFHKEAFPEGIIQCQYRKLKNLITESYIDMFATDEEGKAEGKHPLKYDGKFCIIVDEGKTVEDKIYNALERCTGSTHRLDISSAGKASGQFYVDWEFDDERVYKRKITAFDCKHIRKDTIEKKIAKHGLNDPLVQSSIFSNFNSSDQQVVITKEVAKQCSTLCSTWIKFGPIRAGLDLAAGGDENSFRIWHGNKELAEHNFRYTDTNKTVDLVIDIIRSYNGLLLPENIRADDGGVGRGILDNFRRIKDSIAPNGYNFVRVMNQSKPYDTSRYANRGTELWFNFKRFVEAYQVLFTLDSKGNIDKTLLEQLSNRYYFISKTTNKLQLESKPDAKAKGHPSPDRADAVILAWSPYIYPLKDMNFGRSVVSSSAKDVEKASKESQLEELAQKLRRQRMDTYWALKNGSANKKGTPLTYNSQQLSNRGVPSFTHANLLSGRVNKRRF